MIEPTAEERARGWMLERTEPAFWDRSTTPMQQAIASWTGWLAVPELYFVAPRLAHPRHHRAPGREIYLVRSGVDVVRAARCVAEMLSMGRHVPGWLHGIVFASRRATKKEIEAALRERDRKKFRS